jgi:homocysteine S-methyltransferase
VVENPFGRILKEHGTVVLDGALATELERRGADLKDPLWSAKVLVEDPDAIAEVHVAYFDAGADGAISASYQATFEGLAGRGIDRTDAATLMRRSVELAREVAGVERLVAGSIGPYGAMLGNGAEYTGDYDKGRGRARRVPRGAAADQGHQGRRLTGSRHGHGVQAARRRPGHLAAINGDCPTTG